MSKRSYILFLSFVLAGAGVHHCGIYRRPPRGAFFHGPKTTLGERRIHKMVERPATSSLLYLVLPIVMGVLLRFTKIVDWLGDAHLSAPGRPVNLDRPRRSHLTWNRCFGLSEQSAPDDLERSHCSCTASSRPVLPMWFAVAAPRTSGECYFLYAALGGGDDRSHFLAAIRSSIQPSPVRTSSTPASTSQTNVPPCYSSRSPAAPCLGISLDHRPSGTDRRKQLRCEPDAKVIGYGAMLLEAMVAIVSLCLPDDARQ